MSLINIISLITGVLVLLGYGLYFLYLSEYQAGRKVNLSKKIKRLFEDSNEKEKSQISLLKTSSDNYFKSKLPKIEGLQEWIQHSGLEIKPAIFIFASIIVGVIAGVSIFVFFHHKIFISILLGTVSAFFFPWLFIALMTKQRKKNFLEEFPIAMDIIRRALRAGHSIDRAITMVVEQMEGPVGGAFKRMIDQLNLGRPFEEVLAEMANRVGIDDFRMLAIVIVLQRETGGSLAEAIDNFSKIIRSRQYLRKKIKALTAEVRVTAMILTAIPFVIFGAVYVTTPNYFDPLFYTDRGQTVLIAGIAMLALGIGLIIRMTYQETY